MPTDLYPDKPCIECGKPSLGRNLCPTHYNAAWRIENATRFTRQCACCGETYSTSRPKSTLCSPQCQRIKANEGRAALAARVRLARTAPAIRTSLNPAPAAPINVVRGGFFVMGWCTECGAQFVSRHTVMVCGAQCQKARDRAKASDSRHRRRALMRGAFVSRVYRAQIFKRDDYTCQLCKKPVDMDAKAPAPRSPTIDHIIALAAGGSHEPRNTQLACFLCNSTKGSRPMVTNGLF